MKMIKVEKEMVEVIKNLYYLNVGIVSIPYFSIRAGLYLHP
jgi:hypothetical protein